MRVKPGSAGISARFAREECLPALSKYSTISTHIPKARWRERALCPHSVRSVAFARGVDQDDEFLGRILRLRVDLDSFALFVVERARKPCATGRLNRDNHRLYT